MFPCVYLSCHLGSSEYLGMSLVPVVWGVLCYAQNIGGLSTVPLEAPGDLVVRWPLLQCLPWCWLSDFVPYLYSTVHGPVILGRTDLYSEWEQTRSLCVLCRDSTLSQQVLVCWVCFLLLEGSSIIISAMIKSHVSCGRANHEHLQVTWKS